MAGGQAETVQFLAAAGLAVAFGHLLFNIIGTCIFWPLSWIPISLAKGYAKLAARRRLLAGIYIVVIFFLIPLVVIFAVRWLG
jgi:sodium-dependent phosphate cotransporter